MATGDGCLVRAELRFHCRAEMAGDDCPGQPPEATRELSGPHARSVLRTWVLEDPQKEVNRIAQHLIELVVRARGGPDGLAQEAGGKADAQLVDFVGLLIDAGSTASLLEDEGRE